MSHILITPLQQHHSTWLDLPMAPSHVGLFLPHVWILPHALVVFYSPPPYLLVRMMGGSE